jgi:hypothetical protein
MNYKKPAVIIVTSTMIAAALSCEGHEPIAVGAFHYTNENPHDDQRQYEEPSRTTYEFASSTVTATISHRLFPGDFSLKTIDQRFRIKL